MLALLTLTPTKSFAQMSSVRDSRDGRPFILFVHGRSQEGRSDSAIVFEWLGAMKEGLKRAGDSTLFDSGDVAFVMYQHFYETPAHRDERCPGGRPVSAGIADGDVVEKAFRNAAIQKGDTRSAKDVSLDMLRAGLARMPNTTQTLGLWRAEDTRLYLDRATVEHCSTDRALVHGFQAARGRPLIIVAHSMGGLVDYDVLTRDTALVSGVRVVRLITLGTQVGFRPMAESLTGRADIPFPYPRVGRWVNIHDVDDPVGWPTYDVTKELFAPNAETGVPPIDIPIHMDNAYHHAISGYLSHPVVVHAIAGAWCKEAKPRPATCDRFAFEDVGPGNGPPGVPAWNLIAKRTVRFGGAAALGAIAGAVIARNDDYVASRKWPTIALTGGGAVMGALVALAWDRWFPNQ